MAKLNGFTSTYRAERGDAFAALESAAAAGGYDLVLLDPPKLAPRRSARKKAEALMQRLAFAGCRATRPGGLLALCSCSHALGVDQVQRALALGARAADREARVVERVFQDVDHPVLAAFPEGLYLSSVLAVVD
jgi:23S rRNA (cytosine1962-C5)-methyltransferase